jgi:hypothetical protein
MEQARAELQGLRMSPKPLTADCAAESALVAQPLYLGF